MFSMKREKPKESAALNLPKSLSKKDRKKVEAIVAKARKDDGVPRTAQQSIPFQRMFQDGICRTGSNYYSKTIQFQDINYQLAQQEDKTAIFDEWCGFLNFFDSSVNFELSFMNLSTDAADFEKSIRIPLKNDGFNDVREEYSKMLRTQLAQGNNGLTKTKYLTFGIEAESMKQAKPRLIHIQTDILNNFRRLGVVTKVLNGKERLKLMHDMFHMGDKDRFFFEWKWLVESGLSAKDFIAPSSFSFPGGRHFRMGDLYGAMSFLAITASDLSDQLLKELLDMESSQIVTMHIRSLDQNKAIKTVKHTITELDRSKIEEQKKAVRAGYDMDIMMKPFSSWICIRINRSRPMSIRKTDMIYLRVTPQERKRIEEKMAELGIHNMSAYIRKMALDGLCICLDLNDIRSLTEQVARCGNNLNQYAKRANENGSIYAADIMDLQEQFQEILDTERSIFLKLAALK